MPCTYLLTALQGDEGDLIVGSRPNALTVNVKTSVWQPEGDNPCALCHLAVKVSEFGKLPDLFAQVMVHLEPAGGEGPHVHLCGWIMSDSPTFENPEVRIIPNTGGSRGSGSTTVTFALSMNCLHTYANSVNPLT